MLPAINLRARSSYSIMASAMTAKKMPEYAASADQPAMGMIDTGSLAGALEFATAARKKDVQPIVGCEFSTEAGAVTVIAENKTGWGNLLKLSRAQAKSPEKLIQQSDVLEYADGLMMLAGAPGSALINLVAQDKAAANSWIKKTAAAFGDRFFIEISRAEGRTSTEAVLNRISEAYRLPLVGTSPAAYRASGNFEILELLHAVEQKRIIDDPLLSRPIMGQHFKTSEELRQLFADAPHVLENAARMALRCSDDSAPMGRKPMLPRFPDAKGQEEAMMREMAASGFEKRIAGISADKLPLYRARLNTEMDIICSQGFAGYFLIVADFISWSKRNNIPVGPGRGSGAGSAVAWALGITDLDPIRWGLLFERFINPDRVSLPDFDVDFCMARRDETIAYVRQKYGEDKVVAIGTHGSWGARSAFKDAARSLSISNGAAHAASELLSSKDTYSLSETDPDSPHFLSPDVRDYFRQEPALEQALIMAEPLQGFVRQHGRHAAGIIIADPDVGDVVPIMRDPGGGSDYVTQFDMKGVEECGLVKFDFLGLKTTTIIHEAVQHVRTSDPAHENLDILEIPFDDPEIFAMLNKGDCHGIFQLESEGMVKALKQIRPTLFEDLVAIISLYRPGPMDNIPAFANRKNGHEPVQVPHPKLRELLEETQGIMVYQEQVMQAAQILAGYTLGEADLLRRAMGKKIQAEMDAQRLRFVDGAKRNRISEEKAVELFNLIDKFAGYGFNKSHAAAYALLTWQSSWLKCYHPAAFYAAALTYNDGDFDKMRKIIREARLRGIEFLPPHLDKSSVHFLPERTESGAFAVRWGLGSIKGIGSYSGPLSNECRGKGFTSLEQVARAMAGHGNASSQIKALAAAGVLDPYNKNRVAAAEHLLACIKFESGQTGQDLLFELTPPTCPKVADLPDDEKRAAEIEAIGISFHEHPLAGAISEARRLSAVNLSQIDTYAGCGSITVLVRVDGTSKSPRGTTTYVKLSDASGEVECEVQALPTIGEAIIAQIARKTNEPRWRLLSFQSFVPVEVPKRMRLDIKASHNWEAIRSILIAEGRGVDRIDIMIDLGDRKARKVMPSCFNITPELKTLLLTNPDVISATIL